MYIGIRHLTGLVVGLCFVCSGCATMMRTSSEPVRIVTVPDTATVSLSTGETCTSPSDLSVKRRDSIEVTVVKRGCTTEIVPLESEMDGTGQLITFGPIMFGALSTLAVGDFYDWLGFSSGEQAVVAALGFWRSRRHRELVIGSSVFA